MTALSIVSQLDHDEHSKLTLGTDYLVPVSIPAKRGGGPYYAIARAAERPLPYLGYTEESHLGKLLRSHAAFANIADRLVAHAKSAHAETLRAGALTGLGVAWLPYSLIRSNLEDGDLTLASDDDAHYVPLTIDVYRQRRASRDEVLKCWEIWRAHILSLDIVTPALPGIQADGEAICRSGLSGDHAGGGHLAIGLPQELGVRQSAGKPLAPPNLRHIEQHVSGPTVHIVVHDRAAHQSHALPALFPRHRDCRLDRGRRLGDGERVDQQGLDQLA